MQKPAGVDEMSIVTLINLICPASCEKSSLLRYSILLPKIECPSIIRSKIGQSITFLLSITEMVQVKTGISRPAHFFPITKNGKDAIETP
jgi:hypothetical protein